MAEYRTTDDQTAAIRNTQVQRNIIQHSIYGREIQLAELHEAFRWAAMGSSELVLMSGPPGVGKSAVVLEAFRPDITGRSYFAWGKFDRYSRSKPYGIWIQCFQFLIRKMLTKPDETLNKWKTRFTEMVGSNAAVIADEIPELRLLFDGLPQAEPLPPRENQNRFEWVFRRFVQTFTSSRHPLVLFLDDIQWADRASLQLLQTLIEDPDNRHVCIICAYRDTEWTENTDILEQWLSDQASGYSLRRVRLQHLELAEVQQWVSDMLRMSISVCFPLAHTLFVKSVGNPFYLKQLLQSALDDGIIFSDEAAAGQWRWDEEKLNRLPGIEGQIDYLMGRINSLPGVANRLLAYASTLGAKFSSQLVSAISGLDERQVISQCEHAVQAGLLAVRGMDKESVLYEFTHDQVLHAAYSLLDEYERRRVHLAAAKHLLQHRKSSKAADDLYKIANHLNEAGDLLDDRLTKTCIDLNEEAGRLAMRSSDYASALRHFRHALERMPDHYWHSRQPFAFGTLLACCECEYLCANFEQADAMLDQALQRAVSWEQRAYVVKLKIDQYSNTGQYAKAVGWGLSTLKEAGIQVSPEPSRWTVNREVMRTKRLFEEHMDRFLVIPPTDDPKALRIMELFASLVGPSFFRNRDVFAVLSAQLIRYIYEHGAPAGSPAVYAAFGMVLTTMFGDFAAGYRIGRLAVESARRSGNSLLQARTHVLFHAAISQWMTMDEQAADELWEASRVCVESGDYVFGSYALGGLINLSYGSDPLPAFDHILRQSLQISELTNEELVYTNIMIYRQLCSQLQSPECRDFLLEDENGDEAQALDKVSRQESGAVTLYQIYTYKTQVHYLFGNPEEAIRCASLADPYEASAVQSPHKFVLRFYETLALASASRVRELSGAEQRRLRLRQREFVRYARMSPERFGHYLKLMQAEIRSPGLTESEVMRLYDEAIDLASQKEDWHVWAVACECAAAYYQRQDRRRIAAVYRQEAYEAYERWGIEAKCADLRSQFGQHLMRQMTVETAAAAEDTGLGNRTPAGFPDDEQWLLRLKESLRFPADLDFEQTKSLLWDRIIQLSQSSYGCLVAWRDEELRVERRWNGASQAGGGDDEAPSGGRQNGKHAKCEWFPRSMVQYAFRIGKPVQTDNVLEDDLFRDDPYFRGYAGGEVVWCLPLHLQEEPAGVLYLEFPASASPLQDQQQHALTVLSAQTLYYARLSETLQVQAVGPEAEAGAGRGTETDRHEAGPFIPLSDREYEVLQLISQGMTNKEIAIQLGLTPGTVKVHTHNIFNKLNVNRRTQAIAQARRLKLLDS
jgi:predicted ATPase/DNA-binding CsgD family transcriptional regulator/GAF domain-containing protein